MLPRSTLLTDSTLLTTQISSTSRSHLLSFSSSSPIQLYFNTHLLSPNSSVSSSSITITLGQPSLNNESSFFSSDSLTSSLLLVKSLSPPPFLLKNLSSFSTLLGRPTTLLIVQLSAISLMVSHPLLDSSSSHQPSHLHTPLLHKCPSSISTLYSFVATPLKHPLRVPIISQYSFRRFSFYSLDPSTLSENPSPSIRPRFTLLRLSLNRPISTSPSSRPTISVLKLSRSTMLRHPSLFVMISALILSHLVFTLHYKELSFSHSLSDLTLTNFASLSSSVVRSLPSSPPSIASLIHLSPSMLIALNTSPDFHLISLTSLSLILTLSLRILHLTNLLPDSPKPQVSSPSLIVPSLSLATLSLDLSVTRTILPPSSLTSQYSPNLSNILTL
ncbi:hypothetical protein Tco_0999404 [Tanacetum coccineum]